MKTSDYENLLRDNIPYKVMLLNYTKRVQTFEGIKAYDYLKSKGMDEKEVHKVMNSLLKNDAIVKADLFKKENNCTVALGGSFRKEDIYIWVKEKPLRFSIFMSFVIIAIFLMLVMFQLWPKNLKNLVSYASYPVLGFLALFLLTAFIRLVFFAITFFTNYPGIWIFPNLLADVGFFESFVPLWEYNGVESKTGKKVD